VLDHQRWRQRRRRRRSVVVVVVVPPAPSHPATGRAGTDTGTDGPRAPGHVVHARPALYQDGETDEGKRDADQAAGRRHESVVAQQPHGRLRQRQKQRQVDRHDGVVGRRMMRSAVRLL